MLDYAALKDVFRRGRFSKQQFLDAVGNYLWTALVKYHSIFRFQIDTVARSQKEAQTDMLMRLEDKTDKFATWLKRAKDGTDFNLLGDVTPLKHIYLTSREDKTLRVTPELVGNIQLAMIRYQDKFTSDELKALFRHQLIGQYAADQSAVRMKETFVHYGAHPKPGFLNESKFLLELQPFPRHVDGDEHCRCSTCRGWIAPPKSSYAVGGGEGGNYDEQLRQFRQQMIQV